MDNAKPESTAGSYDSVGSVEAYLKMGLEMEGIENGSARAMDKIARLLSVIIQYSPAENGSVMLINQDECRLRFAFGKNDLEPRRYENEQWVGKAFRSGEGIAGKAWEHKSGMFIADTAQSEMFKDGGSAKVSIKSLISQALVINDEVMGVLNLSHSEANAFPEYLRSVVESLALRMARILAGSQKSLVQKPESQYFTKFMDFLPVHCYQINADGIVVYQNKGSIEMWGDNRGKTLDAINVEGEEKQECMQNFLRVLAGDTIISEFDYVIKDAPVFMRSIMAPVYEDKTIIGAVGFTFDITEHRIVEKNLDREHRLLEQIIARNPFSIAIYDGEGRLVECNDSFRSIFPAPIPQDYTIFKDPVLQKSPVFRDLVGLMKGEVHSIQSEFWLHPPADSKRDPDPQCIMGTVFSLRDDMGQVNHVITMHQDITDRKQAEVSLMEARKHLKGDSLRDWDALMADSGLLKGKALLKWLEKQGHRQDLDYRMMVEAFPHGMVLLQDAKCVYINDVGVQMMRADSREQIIGRNMLEVITAEYRDYANDFYQRRLSGDESVPVHYDIWATRFDGTRFLASISASVIEQNGEKAVILVFRDITNTRRLEKFLDNEDSRLQKVLEVTSLCFVEYNVFTGTVNFSDMFFEMTGYESNGLPESMDEVIASYIHSDDQKELEERFQLCRQGRKASFSGTVRLRHRNGEWLWIKIQAKAIDPDVDDVPMRIIAAIWDISEDVQIKQNLIENEEKYRTIVENQLDYVIRVSAEYIFEFASPSFSYLLGRPESEIVGHSPFEFIHPDDYGLVDKSRDDVMRPPYIVKEAVRFRTRLGWRWIEWHIRAIVDDNKELQYYVAAGRDVTEQRRLQDALQVSETRLNEVLTSANNIVFCYNVSKNKYEYLSASAETVTGVSNEEYMQMSFEDIQRDSHPDDVPRVMAMFEEKTRQTPPGGKFNLAFEYRRKMKDGIYRWFQDWLTVLLDEKKKMHRIIGSTYLIDDRIAIQEELRSSRAKFRTLVESIKAPILLIRGVKALFCNQALVQMLGYDEKEIKNRDFVEFLGAESRALFRQRVDSLLKGDSNSGTFSVSLVCRSGEIRNLQLSPRTIEYQEKQAVLLSAADITLLRRAEEQARESERFINSVLNAIQDGICVVDREMNVIRANNCLQEWYRHRHPIIGQKCYAVFQSRNRICPNCPTLNVFKNGKAETSVVEKMGPDSKPCGWVEISSYPIRDSRGNITSAVEHVRDISEKRKEERKTRNYLRQFKVLERVSRIFLEGAEPVIPAILDLLVDELDVDHGIYFTADNEKKTFRYIYGVAQKGKRIPDLSEKPTPMSFLPWANEQINTKNALSVNDIEKLPDSALNEKEYCRRIGSRAFVTLPVRTDEGRLLGILTLGCSETRHWSREDMRILIPIAGNVATYIIEQERLGILKSEIEVLENRSRALGRKLSREEEAKRIADQQMQILLSCLGGGYNTDIDTGRLQHLHGLAAMQYSGENEKNLLSISEQVDHLLSIFGNKLIISSKMEDYIYKTTKQPVSPWLERIGAIVVKDLAMMSSDNIVILNIAGLENTEPKQQAGFVFEINCGNIEIDVAELVNIFEIPQIKRAEEYKDFRNSFRFCQSIVQCCGGNLYARQSAHNYFSLVLTIPDKPH
ncbi:MAG: PAS domain S-box protein [Candidatus Sumerlaeia bacterium]